jgi:peroxiredoxin
MITKRVIASFIATTLVNVVLTLPSSADERDGTSNTAKYARMGHSKHGEAFDEGPRQRPWKMEGIGTTHFPITTSIPEVQEWFDQGHTLLHSYWYYEAERAFRWCLKLDPECAMAYWGLYRCASNEDKRAAAFLREASKRKDKVSERERMYIEAWEARTSSFNPLWFGPGVKGQEDYLRKLEGIALKYPDDLEAKLLCAGDALFASPARYGNELILQEILAKQPDHPGAHHYRIHLWLGSDGSDAAKALDSFVHYPRVAPNLGHAQHMSGHGYAAVGMWHEATLSLDAMTRLERQYMRQRMIFPFHNDWYTHYSNLLCHHFEQLGMADAAVAGARQLLGQPYDPKYNNPDKDGAGFNQGLDTLVRALVKFERWEEILTPDAIPFRSQVSRHSLWKAYAEALAHLGLDHLAEAGDRLAELQRLQKEATKPQVVEGPYGAGDALAGFVIPEIEGLLFLARGDKLEGVRRLTEAAELELEHRENDNNSPAQYPRVLYNVVGETYLQLQSPGLAVPAFEKVLKAVPNDAVALSGLARAHFALSEKEKAAEYYGRLLHVWSEADPGLRWMESAKALGLAAQPRDVSPAPQRNYRKTNLDHFGPAAWEPYAAPKLEALEGKNLVLVFYLGEECVHCVEQLIAIKDRINDFLLNRTEVVAISSASPERIASSEKMAALPLRLLSDTDHANAKRFHSYDEFEDMELHATILIDGCGKVRWARTGGDPFMELDFLVSEIKRVNGVNTTMVTRTGAGGPNDQERPGREPRK